MNILPNKKVLESLIQSKPGEICYVEDEKEILSVNRVWMESHQCGIRWRRYYYEPL